MNQDLFTKLDELKQKIETEHGLMDATSIKEWCGADVIIRSRLDDDTKKWLGNQHW